MFQKLKKAAVLLTCTLSVTMIGGCGKSFDASAYAKAILDNTYKNDSSGFVEMEVGTAEEAADIYNDGIDSYMQQVTATLGLTDEQAEEFHSLFADVFSKVKYTVGEAEKLDDDSYNVTVNYQKMNIFGPTVETYMADVMDMSEKIASGEETMSEDEVYTVVINMFKDSMSNALANVTYEDEASMTVHIKLENNTYSFEDSAANELEAAFFDLDAFSSLMTQ